MSQEKRLIVGLGNPTDKYVFTHHNVGFIVVDYWVTQQNLSWNMKKKLNSQVATGEFMFSKPQTFMNLSGTAVAKLLNYYNILPTNLLVVHDDVDLPFEKTKLSFGSGSAGHHGVDDIIEKLGTKEFWRLRIGIGRPLNDPHNVESYVLSRLTESQVTWLSSIKTPNFSEN